MSDADPLASFLRARIAEDVTVAGDAGPTVARVPRRTGRWVVDKEHPGSRFPPGFRLGDDAVFVDDGDEGMALVNGREVAEHIARHDPVRALADATAKTAVLDLHTKTYLEASPFGGHKINCPCDDCHACKVCVVLDPDGYHHGDWPCETLRILAQPYRIGPDGTQHPEWQDEWTIE
jgi:hypothetical protein